MQTSWILLVLLILSSAFLFFWGLYSRHRICQYPFLLGFSFIAFIIPQAVVIQANPYPATESSVERVLLMAILCASMCWLGYKIKIPKSTLIKSKSRLNMGLLRTGGFLYSCIGCILWMIIYSREEARGVGQYWTGIITVYVFFANILNIGFTVLLLDLLQKPKLYKVLLILPGLSMLVTRAVISGRRTGMIFLAFSFMCALYFIREILPSRKFMIAGLIIATLTITSVHQYRVIVKSGNWSDISKINVIENFNSLSENEKGKSLELRNAAVFIESTIEQDTHQFGASYWDRLVFRWVPAQFFGKEFKENLNIGITLNDKYEMLYNLYGYKHQKGTTLTGIGDSFFQFDYLG